MIKNDLKEIPLVLFVGATSYFWLLCYISKRIDNLLLKIVKKYYSWVGL